jgi:hypothetical protein
MRNRLACELRRIEVGDFANLTHQVIGSVVAPSRFGPTGCRKLLAMQP